MPRLARKVLGPYDVAATINAGEPQQVCEFPFWQVKGGLIAITVTDNFSFLNTSGPALAVADVAIVGVIQGFPNTIARQYLRTFTGPLVYTFETWEVFETIQIRARNMTGGKRGPEPSIAAAPPNTFNGVKGVLELNVTIQPGETDVEPAVGVFNA